MKVRVRLELGLGLGLGDYELGKETFWLLLFYFMN